MNPGKLISAAALTAALLTGSLSAQALILSGTTLNGNTANVVSSTNGVLAIDYGIVNTAPVSGTFTLEDADAGSIYSFNSIVDNLIGLGFARFSLMLSGGATFGPLGDTIAQFGDISEVTLQGPASVRISFDPAEPFGLLIGNTFDGDAEDWQISLADLAADDSFSLTVRADVPAPAPLALLAIGGLAGLAMRRKGKAD